MSAADLRRKGPQNAFMRWLYSFAGYKKHLALTLMFLPVIAYFIIFKYRPMLGIVIAFKNFKIKQGIWGSAWCGLDNFTKVFATPTFARSVRNTLIISGLGCVCEPVSIAIAGNQAGSGNVTARDIWNDEAGSWEVQLNMHDLPESDEPFTIRAEYLDVIGSPAELSVKYNDFVAPADVISPLFRAMPIISGMAEPNAAVQMYPGKDTGRRFEAYQDSFGHFVFDDVDLMMPGDTFTVIVTDVAGNQEVSSYTIPGPDENGLLRVTGTLSPLGLFVYAGQKGRSDTYTVTPVDLSMATGEDLTIPLLFGSSYKAGEVKVSQEKGGVVIRSELDPEVFADPENYSVNGDTFFVYTSRPSAGELAAGSGTPYHFGDVIRTDGAQTIWIADGRSLEMRASDVSALELYNFRPVSSGEAAAAPLKNREFQTYYNCQTYSGQAVFLPDDDGTVQR